MNRWALPLLVLVLAPLAAANVQYSGSIETRQDHVPQMHCELVQALARTRVDPLRCDLTGRLQEAEVLRIRVAGPGRVYAFLYDEVKGTQVAQVECTATLPAAPAVACAKTFGGMFGYSGARVTLRALMDGPGGAAAVVTVEKVQLSLP